MRRLENLVRPKLGVLYQHPPIPLRIPGRYRRIGTEVDVLPVITIVTPSLDQGDFLERTIQSVLGQDYPRLEYVVQDGGSRDATREILERYAQRLSRCVSEPDRGQADAINRGFRGTTGEVMGWLNSDDLLLPGTLHRVARFFIRNPEVDVVYGHRIVIDAHDREVGRWVLPPHDRGVLHWADFVPQETVFWRRRIWDRAGGGLDESFAFALDWDLFARFQDADASFVRLPRFLAAFRVHPQQKTTAQIADCGDKEMRRLRERFHGRPVTQAEVDRRVTPYLRKAVVCDVLWRFGLLRY